MARQYGRALCFLLGENKMKRLVTSGELQRMFLAEDEKTIIRRPNCRQFCLDNDIFMEIHDKVWLIEIKPFMAKLNPRKLKEHYELPKMRNIRQCVKLWNNTHKRFGQMIDKHTVERCIKDKRVFAYHFGNRWIINYNQLAVVITEFFEKTDYKIRRLKRKNAKKTKVSSGS